MVGPIEAMDAWQQLAIGGGLFAAMVWLQTHPAQPQKRPRARAQNRRKG